jgi:hypothetical protein
MLKLPGAIAIIDGQFGQSVNGAVGKSISAFGAGGLRPSPSGKSIPPPVFTWPSGSFLTTAAASLPGASPVWLNSPSPPPSIMYRIAATIENIVTNTAFRWRTARPASTAYATTPSMMTKSQNRMSNAVTAATSVPNHRQRVVGSGLPQARH